MNKRIKEILSALLTAVVILIVLGIVCTPFYFNREITDAFHEKNIIPGWKNLGTTLTCGLVVLIILVLARKKLCTAWRWLDTATRSKIATIKTSKTVGMRALRNCFWCSLIIVGICLIWYFLGDWIVSSIKGIILPKSANLGTIPAFMLVFIGSVVLLVLASLGKNKRRGWKLYLFLSAINLLAWGASYVEVLLVVGLILFGYLDLVGKKSYSRTGWIFISSGIHGTLFLVIQAGLRLFSFLTDIEHINGYLYTSLPFTGCLLMFGCCFSTKLVPAGHLGWITLFNQWPKAGANIAPGLVCLPFNPKIFKWFIQVESKPSTATTDYLGAKEGTPVKIQAGAGATSFDAMVELSFAYSLKDTWRAVNRPIKPANIIEYAKGALTARLIDATITGIDIIKGSQKSDIVKYVLREANSLLMDHGYEISSVTLIEAEEVPMIRDARVRVAARALKEQEDALDAETDIEIALKYMAADPTSKLSFAEAVRMAQRSGGKIQSYEGFDGSSNGKKGRGKRVGTIVSI